MTNSTLRRNMIFVAGSVVTGLAIALLANRLWPQRGESPPLAAAPALPAAVAPLAPAAAPTPAIDAAGAAPGSGPASTGTDAQAVSMGSFAAAVRNSAPAVVSIYTATQRKVRLLGMEKQLGADGQLQQEPVDLGEGLQQVVGLGSGVIFDTQGHIITNEHVIKAMDQIRVKLADGRVVGARILGSDPATDLAVLKIDLPRLPVMPMGRSDQLAVGDAVLAIGNPLGLSQTVTHGIVSAVGRALEGGVATFESFIQTDAAINVGNSGGALVNARGELVGINTAVLGKERGAEGLSVAIPVNLVRGVVQEILRHGRVVRGSIGIAVKRYSEEEAREAGLPYAGLVVLGLARESPARQTGGLEISDKIETIDGQPVQTLQEVASRIASHKAGSIVRFAGIRLNGQPFSAAVKVVGDDVPIQ